MLGDLTLLAAVQLLLAVWALGTILVLGIIVWRARRRDEPPRVGLLWDDRPY